MRVNIAVRQTAKTPRTSLPPVSRDAELRGGSKSAALPDARGATPAGLPARCCRKRTPMRWSAGRAAAAGIVTKLGNHSFRATGITAYLKNGGTLEKAAAMANHASTRTTQLYDRRRDELSLDEVERIVI